MATAAPEIDIDRIVQLADTLEGMDDQAFSMNVWIEPYPGSGQNLPAAECRTVACIAGRTLLLFHPAAENIPTALIPNEAQTLLGLDDDQAYDLFTPTDPDSDGVGHHVPETLSVGYHQVTTRQAADTLRYLAETGIVHWFEQCLCPECAPDYQCPCDDCLQDE